MHDYASWVLAVIGVTGIFFVGRKTIWGWYVLLFNEVLWIAYAINTDQYGFIFSAIGTPLTLSHILATPYVVVSVTKPTAGNYPSVALVHGIDYSYSVLSNGSISLTALSAAAANAATWVTIIG